MKTIDLIPEDDARSMARSRFLLGLLAGLWLGYCLRWVLA